MSEDSAPRSSIAPQCGCDRSSVAPVALSCYPTAPASACAPIRFHWVLSVLLPTLGFALVGAAAYASPPPRYAGPPAERAIALPDVVVIDQPTADNPSTDDDDEAPAATSEATAAAESTPPAVWVYDLPVAGKAAPARVLQVEQALTVSPDELPVVRSR